MGKNNDNQTMNYLMEISYLAPQKLVEDCAYNGVKWNFIKELNP